MRNVKYIYLVFLGVLAGMMYITSIAQAAPLGPTFVPGKEYSDELDKDSAGILDDMQNIEWDGAGGVIDAFDYNAAGGTSTLNKDQVDAIANRTDFLFTDVTANIAPIVYSERIGPDSPSAGATDTAAPIYFEETGGVKGTWATSAQVNAAIGLPKNLDGLELWGGVDADRFSLFGDSISGTSVYLDDGSFTPYISHAEIAAVAGGLLLGQGITVSASKIDIDAMMLFDIGLNDLWEAGDKIMFSLWSVAATGLTGDGVYVYTKGGPASILFHGGHLWSEHWNGDINIDALEAVLDQGTPPNVPEPSTIALLGIGLAGLGGGYLRRRRRQKQEIRG